MKTLNIWTFQEIYYFQKLNIYFQGNFLCSECFTWREPEGLGDWLLPHFRWTAEQNCAVDLPATKQHWSILWKKSSLQQKTRGKNLTYQKMTKTKQKQKKNNSESGNGAPFLKTHTKHPIGNQNKIVKNLLSRLLWILWQGQSRQMFVISRQNVEG